MLAQRTHAEARGAEHQRRVTRDEHDVDVDGWVGEPAHHTRERRVCASARVERRRVCRVERADANGDAPCRVKHRRAEQRIVA